MSAKFEALPKAKRAAARRAALAKANEALRQFTGELSSPILVPGPNGKWGPLSTTSLKREIAKQRQAKVDLLFAHYRIRWKDKDRWLKLCARLASDLVPGMITIEQSLSPYKHQKDSHKDKIWSLNRYTGLVRDVDAIRAAYGKRKIFAVICDLVKQQPEKWGTYKGRESSLVTRYHEGMAKIETNWNASSIGLWEPSKF
jgi:hypothetical protein